MEIWNCMKNTKSFSTHVQKAASRGRFTSSFYQTAAIAWAPELALISWSTNITIYTFKYAHTCRHAHTQYTYTSYSHGYWKWLSHLHHVNEVVSIFAVISGERGRRVCDMNMTCSDADQKTWLTWSAAGCYSRPCLTGPISTQQSTVCIVSMYAAGLTVCMRGCSQIGLLLTANGWVWESLSPHIWC